MYADIKFWVSLVPVIVLSMRLVLWKMEILEIQFKGKSLSEVGNSDKAVTNLDEI